MSAAGEAIDLEKDALDVHGLSVRMCTADPAKVKARR
jgi:hypothetical protein